MGENPPTKPQSYSGYSWSNGIVDSSIVVGPGTQRYSVNVVDNFGIESSDSVEVIYPIIGVYSGAEIMCLGETELWNTLMSHSTYSFVWSDGSIDSLKEISVTGYYSVTINDGQCTYASDTEYVYVDDFSEFNALFSTDTVFCSGNTIGVDGELQGAETYAWSNGSSDSSITITQSDVYIITVTNGQNCQLIDSIDVVVTGMAPTVGFTYSDVCQGTAVLFHDTSTVADGFSEIVTRTWDFGDGQVGTSADTGYTYNTSGQYTVTLTAITDGGCSNVSSEVVSVYPNPEVSFVAGLNRCVGYSVNYVDSSSIDNGSLSSNSWDFGDGNTSTGETVSHIYSTPGTYPVSLTVSSTEGCTDILTETVEILDSVGCFLPKDLLGISMWLRADSMLSTQGGELIWGDLSGMGNDGHQSISGSQPILDESDTIINMKSAIHFDGQDDYLLVDSSVVIQTLVVISRWSGNGTSFPSYSGLITRNTSIDPRYILIGESGGSGYYLSGGSNSYFLPSELEVNSTIGVGDLIGTTGYNLTVGRRSASVTGSSLRIGHNSNDGGNCYWNGDIAEIICYDRELSADEIEKIYSYVQSYE